jgi:hypothetical protein
VPRFARLVGMKSMRRPLRAIIPVALVGLTACGGGGTGTSVATASPTPTASSSTSVSSAASPSEDGGLGSLARPAGETIDGTCDGDASCLGLLDAGEHTSVGFDPTLTFTVPAGWANPEDRQGLFALLPLDIPGDAIVVFGKPEATGNDGRVVAGADNSAAGLATYLRGRPDLDVSATTTTIGGLAAEQLDIAIRPGTVAKARGCEVNVCVMVASGRGKTWDYTMGLAGTERMRVYLVDAAGATMLIIADSLDGATFADITSRADPIVTSMTFR